MRPAWPCSQSQETCRVSPTPLPLANIDSPVAASFSGQQHSTWADIGVFYRKGHYGRALEEAIQTQKSQWPTKWTGNPLSGGRNFNTMTAEERVGRAAPSRRQMLTVALDHPPPLPLPLESKSKRANKKHHHTGIQVTDNQRQTGHKHTLVGAVLGP